MSRIKALLFVLALAFATTGLVACGGGGGGGGNSENAQQVIDQTFSGKKDIHSGNLALVFAATATGTQGGSFNAKLNGPFEGQTGQFPKFQLTASVGGKGSGQSLNFEGGITSTGDNAFVRYQGTDYELGKDVFDQIKSRYEQQAKTNTTQGGTVFSKFGVNPADWLTNLKNEGTTDVGGAKTIHISADADVSKAVDDFKKILQKAPSLGLPKGSSLPSGTQLDQVKSAVKQAHFDIYTGESDKVLRKLDLVLKVVPPSSSSGPSNVDVKFSFAISDLNAPQTITAPKNAKPITDLLGSLGLGGLGGAGSIPGTGGGTGGSGGGTSGGAGGAPGGAPSSGTQQKYLDCLKKAKDQAAIAACAKILQQ